METPIWTSNLTLSFKITSMSSLKLQEQIAQRVERLLLRHEELQRTNQLLTEQVGQLTHERDQFKSRLESARNRIDALLERLPEDVVAKDAK
jgi:FtsZ-binding cell division protein ZapB